MMFKTIILGALFSDTSIYDDQHFCARSLLNPDPIWGSQLTDTGPSKARVILWPPMELAPAQPARERSIGSRSQFSRLLGLESYVFLDNTISIL